jgi:hypothetical protein
MSWNDDSEDFIKQITDNIKSYKFMHLQQAQQSYSFYRKLTLGGIVLGPMASILSSINQVLHPNQNHVIPIIEILLGFLSGIIVAIIRFGKYDEAMNSNQTVAAKYNSLEANITRQMCLYRENRIPTTNYLEWVETKYGEIINSAPIITKNTYDTFVKNATKNGYSVPNRYDSVITINKESLPQIIVEQPLEQPLEQPPEQPPEPNNKLTTKRTTTMIKLPEINEYSDKMLQYQMTRMFNSKK